MLVILIFILALIIRFLYFPNNIYFGFDQARDALGYPGNLIVQEKQEGLPKDRYVIIEPTRGIAFYLVDEYLKEEGYFTKVIQEVKIGKFVIQKRIKI